MLPTIKRSTGSRTHDEVLIEAKLNKYSNRLDLVCSVVVIVYNKKREC